MIDLHMHTVYSDGSLQPEELVATLIENGIQYAAITDHDTTASYPVALKAAEGTQLQLIPGIEINTHWEGKEIHVLGYFIDPENETLQEVIQKHGESRMTQIKEMVELLNKKANIHITFEDISAQASNIKTIGRPHVAQALVNCGAAPTIGEAFKRFLTPGLSTYVRRETATPHEAVEAIYESGGVAVIAHPGDMAGIDDLVMDLMNYGLRGLEAYHRSHSPVMIEYHCTLAEKYGLIVTGGTDFHGTQDAYSNALKHLHVPSRTFEILKTEHERIKMSSFKAS